MKPLLYLVLTVGLIGFLSSCADKPNRPASVLTQSQIDAANARAASEATNPAANTPLPEPPQNADGVWHYTCSNGCAGGAGSAAPCAVCGTTLVHNQAYHSASTTPTATTVTTPLGGTTNAPNATIAPPLTTIPPPVASTPEPAQNAAGVWHYICSNGCSGGGGSATACSSCGSTLAHNQAYHN